MSSPYVKLVVGLVTHGDVLEVPFSKGFLRAAAVEMLRCRAFKGHSRDLERGRGIRRQSDVHAHHRDRNQEFGIGEGWAMTIGGASDTGKGSERPNTNNLSNWGWHMIGTLHFYPTLQ